MKKKQPFYPSI